MADDYANPIIRPGERWEMETVMSVIGGATGVNVVGQRIRWRKVGTSDAAVATVDVSPATASISVGQGVVATAVLRDAGSNILTGRTVAWVSADETKATVDVDPINPLRCTINALVAGGPFNVTCTSEGVSDTCAVTVTAAPNQPPVPAIASPDDGFAAIVGIAVTLDPTGTFDAEGDWQGTWTVKGGVAFATTRFTLTGTLGSLASHITSWTPSVAENVRIDWAVQDVAAQVVTASVFGTVSSSGSAAVATVEVNPASFTVIAGSTQALAATVRDAGNNILTGRVVTWSSGTPSVASVNSSTGVVTGVVPGSATITATCEGISDTSACTVAASGGGFPNEPGGAAVVCQTNFSTIPLAGTGFTSSGMLTGEQSRASSATRVSVVTDATAPTSPSNVLQVEFRSGLGDGDSGFGNMDFWAAGRSTGGAGFGALSTLYVRFVFKVVGPNYENQSVGTKIVYFPYATTARNNHSYLMLNGDGASTASKPNGTIGTNWRLEWWISQMDASTGADPGNSTRNSPNVDTSKRIVVDTWHTIEVLMTKNTSLNANGVAKLWIDGVLVHSHLKRWTSPTNNRGFWSIHKDEVWGGSSGQVKSRADFFRWDHLYVSGSA